MPWQKGQSGNPSGQQDRRKTRAQIAISQLVERHAQHLDRWLEEIYERDGPRAAYQEFVRIVEFALPKLGRREIAGDPDMPVQHVTRVELVAGDGRANQTATKTG